MPTVEGLARSVLPVFRYIVGHTQCEKVARHPKWKGMEFNILNVREIGDVGVDLRRNWASQCVRVPPIRKAMGKHWAPAGADVSSVASNRHILEAVHIFPMTDGILL